MTETVFTQEQINQFAKQWQAVMDDIQKAMQALTDYWVNAIVPALNLFLEAIEIFVTGLRRGLLLYRIVTYWPSWLYYPKGIIVWLVRCCPKKWLPCFSGDLDEFLYAFYFVL